MDRQRVFYLTLTTIMDPMK